MVCEMCVLQFSKWCQRAASEKAIVIILHLKGPRLQLKGAKLPKWILEALQLKMRTKFRGITSFARLCKNYNPWFLESNE